MSDTNKPSPDSTLAESSEDDRPSSRPVPEFSGADETTPARSSHTDSWRYRAEIPTEYDVEDEQQGIVGTVVGGRFLVERLLGRGGMGAVYAAEHTELKKVVALKILHGAMTTNEEVVARFGREAVAAGKLVHPSIVTASDFGRLEDGSFYLALEYVDGKSLADVLEESKVLSAERAVGIAMQVSDALCAAHAEGIVHRDMKPENVMLVHTGDGEDYVKVVDFGIAKVRVDGEDQEGLTRAGLVFGTPEYMSPEQALGHEADERSDLYGVGMLLYEMLVGKSPFFAEDVTEMLAAQIKAPPPPLPAGVPPRLAALVLRLLEKDPAARPQSAFELAEELVEVGKEEGWFFAPLWTSSGIRPDGKRPSVRSRDSHPSYRPPVTGRASSVTAARKSALRVIPLLGLAAGVVIGAGAMLANDEVVPSEQLRQNSERLDAEAQLMDDAGGGDREAISALRKITVAEQTALEKAGLIAKEGAQAAPDAARGEAGDERIAAQANRYLVLGGGYSAIKHDSAAIEMYRQAVRLDPHLSEDTELLIGVRTAIAARDAVEDGLDFALHQLGAPGADLIYDVYLDYLGQVGMTPVVARSMRIAQSDELMTHATPELQIALRLDKAKLCGEFRDILPDAAKFADQRSLAKLEALEVTRGCGTGGTNDCFICLRKDDVPLALAVARARAHPAPTFAIPADPAQAADE